MTENISTDYLKIFCFSIFICLITYGFALTNFSLSIDSESVIYSDMSLSLGRWGTNLIRYHIFGGIIPYFTLLLSLLCLSFAAVEFTKIFSLNTTLSYVFCGIFLSFPQMAYHLIFTMQADVIGLGFLIATLVVKYFLKSSEEPPLTSALYFCIASLLFMFVIALYQALAFIPIVIYIIIFFQNTHKENYTFKAEFKKGLRFILLTIVAVILYFISVKIFAPEQVIPDF